MQTVPVYRVRNEVLVLQTSCCWRICRQEDRHADRRIISRQGRPYRVRSASSAKIILLYVDAFVSPPTWMSDGDCDLI